MTANSSASLDKVAKGDLCAGCGACASVVTKSKVTIEPSPDGYLRPVLHDSLSEAEESHIAAVCPGLSIDLDTEGRKDHPLWGPYISVHRGFSTHDPTRFAGSSGGVLTAALTYLVETGKVDAVIHNTADPQNPLGNLTITSDAADSVLTGAGSRYAPSSPLQYVENYLQTGKRFAFVGKPCDVAALRAMELMDVRIADQIPYKLSFYCAGVPSAHGARKLLSVLGADSNDVTAFRYRGNGWPGYATASLRDGSEKSMTYMESWGKVLSNNLQFRCKICPDGVGSFADLVCADAWHCDERGYPLFEERDGFSIIMTRTEQGRSLLADMVKDKKVEMTDIPVDAIDAMQPGQVWRKSVLLPRMLAIILLFQPRPRYSGIQMRASVKWTRPSVFMRNFLGMCRRLVERALKTRPAS